MKRFPSLHWFTAALMLASLAACQKKAAPLAPETCPPAVAPAAKKIVSSEQTSFEAVTRHLDPGGRSYYYFSTEAVIKALSRHWAEAGPLIFSAATSTGKLDDAAKAKAQAFWQSASTVAARCGLDEITGVGSSSIALEPGYYQTKWMIHHAPGKANGVIWKITGTTPNALDFIGYLPEKTVVASSGNLKLAPIWDALQQEGATNPELKQKLDVAAQQFQQSTGLDLPALLASLGPNYSLAVTMDESRPVSLPVAGPNQPPVTFPEPAAALLVQVQDEVLIRRIEAQISKNPQAVKTDEEGVTLYTMPLPLPIFSYVRPTLGWKQGLLVLGSNDAILREMLAVKAGKKPGFAANADFQKLREGMPTSGSKFGYVSTLFYKTMRSIQTAQLEMAQGNNSNPALKNLMQYIYRVLPQSAMMGVTQETEEGWIGIIHEKTTAPAAK